MKKFSFTLERVLDYKEQVEQNLRNEHGQAVREVKEQEQKIGELETGFRSFISQSADRKDRLRERGTCQTAQRRGAQAGVGNRGEKGNLIHTDAQG